MGRISVISVMLLLSLTLQGQTPVGSWSDHLIYNTTNSVSAGTEEVYASTGSSIIVYNKEFAEVKKMSRINGLTETGISTIAWSEENKALIIGYTSTNIDLLKNNIIYNIPDIYRKYIPGKKEINKIRTSGKYAYLACSFGIVVVDITKKEISDTWKPGTGFENTEVWDIGFGDGKVFAATGVGVYYADLSNQGLAYFGNWNLINTLPDPTGKYTSLIYSGNKLFVNWSNPLPGGDNVYEIDGGSSLISYLSGVKNRSFDPASQGFTVSSSASVKYCNSDGTLIQTISSYGFGTPDITQAVFDNGDIWVADVTSGLIRGENMFDFSALTLPGPSTNNVIHIASLNGKTLICGGAVDNAWNNLWRPLQISSHENNNWNNLTSATIKDAMRALIDPDDHDHFFVSTWGGGLLEYKNGKIAHQYSGDPSPLQTIIPGQPYVRVCGLAMDKYKNLWLTQTGVPGSIKALKPDGSWIVNP
ncbi:MAG: hypothetical protein Q7J06_10575, partial [Bacteroidales bacterium]|nr:hypothetical protein [Bacteroidales bacterium]